MKNLVLLLAVLFAIAGPVSAKSQDIDAILDLLDSRVSESSIRRFVERNHFTFQLTADNLIDLKKAGASDEFIEFIQEREEDSSSEEAQTQGSKEKDAESSDYAVSYGSPDVYLGFGFGFGYPYYSYPYYYSSYYYPGYPIYYPCPYYGGGSTVIVGGGNGGTGVYSYWHQNQARGKPRPSSGTAASSTTISGRVLKTAPAPGSAPRVTTNRGSSSSRQSVSPPTRPSQGGRGGGHGVRNGGSRGGSFHGGGSRGGASHGGGGRR